MTKKPTRGGKREGAGRPPGSGQGRTVTTSSINLPPTLWEKLDRIKGEQTRSAWIADRIKKARGQFLRRTKQVLAPMPAKKRYEYKTNSNAGSGCSSHDLLCLLDSGGQARYTERLLDAHVGDTATQGKRQALRKRAVLPQWPCNAMRGSLRPSRLRSPSQSRGRWILRRIRVDVLV